MKKLQIMAGMLNVLLLVGCGGTGVSAKTAGEDPPQTTSTDVSGPTAAQNEKECASKATAQGQGEKPGAFDAIPRQAAEKSTSVGDTKPAAFARRKRRG